MKKHGIRGLLILALIWALIGAAGAEETLPTSIREAQSAEEANALLIQSDTGERLNVVSGQVRLIVQTRRDDMFCADYWRSGEEKGEFDLTAKENRYGAPYAYYIGTMCTRAVYSMALSYLGVDMTPVDMSGAIAMKRSFPTHIIYVARDKEKLIADIIESDYDTEEKTLRILSIDAEKRNRKICDHVIHNDTITSDFVSGAEELRKLIMPESEK